MSSTEIPVPAVKPARARLTSVLSVVRGTVLAQLIFVLVTPLLTRIYSAEALGVFAVYMAVILVLGNLTSLRYELAIPLPNHDRVAVNLVLVAFLSSFVCLSVLLVLWLASGGFLPADVHELQNHPFLLFFGVLLFVLNESLGYWFIRRRQFSVFATGKVVNAGAIAVFQLAGFGFEERLPILLLAFPAGSMLSSAYLLSKIEPTLYHYRTGRLRLITALMSRYRRFPLYSTWSSALFELSQSLPLLLLTGYFGSAQAGYFFLARRIALVPTSVVGRAITQVNHADMKEHHRQGTLGDVLIGQIRLLQWISFFPAFLIAAVSPWICRVLFGDEWEVVGYYLQLITPYVLVRFAFSPVAAVVYVAQWQRTLLIFELCSTLLSTLLLMRFADNGNGPYMAVGAYFGALFIANLVYSSALMYRLRISLPKALSPFLLQLVALLALLVLLHLNGLLPGALFGLNG